MKNTKKINPPIINGLNRVFFGQRKSDKERIYLDKPTFDCEWYWSFGYLGNRNEHYHLISITENRNKHMYDCLKEDYLLNNKIYQNLWEFCELSQTIYTLKDSAELFHIGGSHITTNPHQKQLKRKVYERTVNEKLLPQQIQTLWNLIGGVN